MQEPGWAPALAVVADDQRQQLPNVWHLETAGNKAKAAGKAAGNSQGPGVACKCLPSKMLCMTQLRPMGLVWSHQLGSDCLAQKAAGRDGTVLGGCPWRCTVLGAPPERVPAAVVEGLHAGWQHVGPKAARGTVQLHRHVRICASAWAWACTRACAGGGSISQDVKPQNTTAEVWCTNHHGQ